MVYVTLVSLASVYANVDDTVAFQLPRSKVWMPPPTSIWHAEDDGDSDAHEAAAGDSSEPHTLRKYLYWLEPSEPVRSDWPRELHTAKRRSTARTT
jgi:hypothetical protein